MIDKEYLTFIEKVVVNSKSSNDAVKLLTSTYYPGTTRKMSESQALDFYDIFKKKSDPVKVDKEYLVKRTKQMYANKGY